MKLAYKCCIALFILSISLGLADGKKRNRRFANPITAAIFSGSLEAGASLTGTSVGALMKPGYSVSVSGSVENFSKFTLIQRHCEAASGYINTPLTTVHGGQKEGFASHKTGNTATGSWVRCTLQYGANTLFHFMYSAPYSFDLHSNWLALAICPKTNSQCRHLNANNMYYKSYGFMRRREYYYSVTNTKVCNDVICAVGQMGTSHHPQIHIKVYAKKLNDASAVIQKSFKENGLKSSNYDNFIKRQFW